MNRMMKNRLLYMAAVFSLLLAGCSQDEMYRAETPGGSPAVLSLQVAADGYRSPAETRAGDTGIETTFTNGDKLGLIISHPDNTMEHAVYTYNGSSWTSSVPAYYDSKDTYAAYYPYREEFQNKSLADIKAAFTPLTDQSDYSIGYAASDLMTCESATLNTTNKMLSITLTHAFSMLRMPVDVPVKSKCGDNNTYEYSVSATDIVFHIGDTPYRAWMDGDGYARLIVSNSGSSIAVKSRYTFRGKRTETGCTISSFASGQYYTVTPPLADLGKYQLSDARVGDFYIKSSDGQSGFVFPKEALSLPESLKKSCIGIVLKVGKDESGDWKDDCLYKKKGGTTTMSPINGYVLALYDANSGSTCQWGSYGIQVGTNQQQNTLFCGYSNTQTIKSYASQNSKNLQNDFPAAYHASVGYETSYSAPDNSSGWFLPSAGQCKYWLNNKETLLASVRKATGDSSYSWKDYYWSSSEDSSLSPASYAWCALFYNGYVDFVYKSLGNYVRSCLAF